MPGKRERQKSTKRKSSRKICTRDVDNAPDPKHDVDYVIKSAMPSVQAVKKHFSFQN